MSYYPSPPAQTGGHGYRASGHGQGWQAPNRQIDPWASTRVRSVPPLGQVPAFVPNPPGPPFPQPPYPRPPQGNARRLWAVLGAVFAVVVVAVSAGLIVVAGQSSQQRAGATASGESVPATTTAAPPAMVQVSALPGLLLDAATVNGIEGAIAMQVQPDPKAGLPFTGGETNRPECAGLSHPARKVALDGSGWIAMQSQYLREPGDDWHHAVTQAVISYGNAEGASKFAAGQAENWAKCDGRSMTITTTNNGPVTWSVGRTGTRDGVLTAVLTQEDAQGWACQRALVARANVIIDVRACGDNTSDQAATIARKIADGIVDA